MKRRLKIAALALGLLVLVVLSFLAWVINTEAGLRFAVARLPEKLGKVTLKIEEVHGTITGGFGARMVDVDQELTHVRVEGGKARVNFWPLLVGRISVRRAEADLVLVEVKRRPKDRPKTPPKFMPRFLSISAERAATPLLVIIAPNGRRVEFNDVSGAGIVGHKVIRVFEGNIIYGFLHSRAIGELQRRGSDEAERRNHHAHDHRRPAGVARRPDFRRRPRQTTLGRKVAGAVPRRPARRAARALQQFPLDRQVRGAQLRPARLRCG